MLYKTWSELNNTLYKHRGIGKYGTYIQMHMGNKGTEDDNIKRERAN